MNLCCFWVKVEYQKQFWYLYGLNYLYCNGVTMDTGFFEEAKHLYWDGSEYLKNTLTGVTYLVLE